MSSPEPKLLKYILANSADLTDRGLPDRFELLHTSDEGHTRLGVYRLADYKDEQSEVLAQEMWDAAEADADTRGVGMMQRYAVVTFRGVDDHDNESQLAFNMQGRSTALRNWPKDSDSPTAKGLQAQQMRHNENMMQMLVQSTEASTSRLVQENQRLRARCEYLETKFTEMVETYQSLADRSHERKMDEKREEARSERHEQMMGVVMSTSQLFAAKFLGGASPIANSLPAAAARDLSISNFMQQLSEEEIKAVMANLRPANQQTLLHIYMSYKEDAEKQAQAKADKAKAKNGAESRP